MRVLVIGSGAREHALCLALAHDPAVTSLVCAPGNAGTAAVAEQRGVDAADGAAVAKLAADVGADLVVIGPEAPLVAGAADAVRDAGIACFGPSRDAAALDEFGPPYVVKDDGLAAGKGVVVTHDRAIALAHADACGRVVIEEFLDGPEVSLFCVTDGTSVVPLVPAQDFKRIGDGDVGPNTGGMGAYAPLPWLPDDFTADVVRAVAQPTIDEMARRGTPFAGLLYIGLAATPAGPRVVEFNARFGDPETQVVLALLESPVSELLAWAASGGPPPHPVWRDAGAVTVVLAAAGYPGTPQTGGVLTGTEQPGVIHAGTRRRDDGAVVSSGGRVLSCTATGTSLQDARDAAYRLVASVHLDGAQWRSDIAQGAVEGTITV